MAIEIYGRPLCDACELACNIAEAAGAYYMYFNVEQMSYEELTYVLEEVAPNAKTVPIIVVDGKYIEDINEFREFFASRERAENIVG